MIKEGRAHKFGDNISTDDIIAGRYKDRIWNIDDMAKHLMENIDPQFYFRIEKGDFIVAGRNFGLGSSREAAPLAILGAGIGAVLAHSFARIFYRNSFNVGLLVVECDIDLIEQGDALNIDIENGKIFNRSKKKCIPFKPIPAFMFEILKDGGLIAHFKNHNGFRL